MRSLLTKSLSRVVFGGRIRRRLISLLLIAAALVYFAPWLIGKTSIVESTVGKSLAGGSVTIGSKSLGWFSPIRLHDVVLRDDRDEVLCHLESIELEKSLVSLLLNRNSLGTIHLKSPHALVKNLDTSSNWEKFAFKLMQEPGGESALKCDIQVSGGEVYVWAGGSEPRLVIGDLQGNATVAGKTIQAELTGASPKTEGSQVGLKVSANKGQGETAGEANVLTVDARSFPLAELQSVLRRFVGDIAPAGNLSGKMDFYWSPLTRLVFRDLQVDNLRVGSQEFLRQDILQASAAKGGLEVLHDGHRWLAKDLAVDLGVAQLKLAGSIPLSTPAFDSKLQAWLPERPLQLSGNADLAAIANMLPHALQLRDQLQITSGRMNFQLSSVAEGEQWTYKADVTTSHIVAQRQQQRIEWRTPFTLNAVFRRSGTEIDVERLSCESDFLSANATGNSRAGQLTATGDLERLTAQLSNFINFQPSWRGSFRLGLAWQTNNGQFAVSGAGLNSKASPSAALVVTNFATRLPGGQLWEEPEIIVELAAQGTRGTDSLQLTEGGATARSRQGFVHGKLTAPVTLAPFAAQTNSSSGQSGSQTAVAKTRSWPLAVSVRGDLAQWRNRLLGVLGQDSPFTAVWRLSGKADVDLKGNFGPNQFDILAGKIVVRGFDIGVNDYYIAEPAVECEVQGRWDFNPVECRLSDASLTTSSLSLRVRDLIAGKRNEALYFKARAGYRADIGRVQNWMRPKKRSGQAGPPAGWQWAGGMLGQADIDLAGPRLVVNLSGDISNMLLASRPSQTGTVRVATPASKVWWREAGLKYAGKMTRDGNKWQFEQVELRGATLAATVNGSLVTEPNTLGINLTGSANCDLDKLTAQLQQILGGQLSLSGQSNSQFEIRGTIPTTSNAPAPYQTLSASSNLNWKQGQALGLPFGEASLNARLEGGVVTLSPLAMKVGAGQLNIAPRVDLRESPMRMVIPQGKLAENIHLSPQICRGWLRYVAPLAADATQAEGKFSLDGRADVPLARPASLRADGQLQIHQARIGPGQLSRELIWIARQVKAIVRKKPLEGVGSVDRDWLVLPQQTVAVQVAEGKVRHENFQMMIGDVLIVTRGIVGFDQSLSLVASIPIRKEWVSDPRKLGRLAGQRVDIPISGSVSRLRFDKRVLSQLGGRAIENAAGRLIEDQLDKGLRKLFGREE